MTSSQAATRPASDSGLPSAAVPRSRRRRNSLAVRLYSIHKYSYRSAAMNAATAPPAVVTTAAQAATLGATEAVAASPAATRASATSATFSSRSRLCSCLALGS